jgi:hypothetical protein
VTGPRLAYAAAHVVMRESYRDVAHAPDAPGDAEEIAAQVDWDATMAFRVHLAEHGFGVGEAMDTAQRMELGWASARRLVEETGRLGLAGGFVAGAWTDHASIAGPDDLVAAVVHQAGIIQRAGGIPIILSMPWLSEHGCDEATYRAVYGAIIAALDGPLLVHWLGPMFLPALAGYFPGDSFRAVMEIDPEKVRGAKLSLLDAERERRLRRDLLERDQVLLTGDDFAFAELIVEDGAPPARRTRIGDRDVPIGDFSHALLGILDGIAAPAGRALRRLADGDADGARALLAPCETLSRIVFESPTHAYKAGLALLAWLNGHQANRMLVNHQERARSSQHLRRVAAAAADAGALTDPALAAERLATV